MKNPRALYLLLPLVLLIWGLIGWRIWSATADADTPPASLPAIVSAPSQLDSTYRPRLLLSYTDPFPVSVGPAVMSRPVNVPSPAHFAAAQPLPSLNLPVRPVTPEVAPPTVSWPPVKYLGVISRVAGEVQVALLQVNNEESAVRVGRSVQGIQVVRLFRDSAQLVLGKQRRTFYRTPSQ